MIIKRPYKQVLKSKFHAKPSDVHEMYMKIHKTVPRGYIDDLIAATRHRLSNSVSMKESCLAFSGGKDSMALTYILDDSGIDSGILFMPHRDVQWTIMDDWFKANKPSYVKVHTHERFNLDYYSNPVTMLTDFTEKANSKYNVPKWQVQYNHALETGKKVLLMGRRNNDGNNCGKQGWSGSKKKGVKIYNPLWDWIIEDIMALFYYKGLNLAPTYLFPGGWKVNTQRWVASKYNLSELWPFLKKHDIRAYNRAVEHFGGKLPL